MASPASPSARLLVFVAAVLAAAPALGDDAKPAKGAKPAPGEPRYDPDNVTAISKYNEIVNRGTGKYLARDFPGALELYRQAVPLAPKNPLAHYLIAETQLSAGNLPEAEASLKTAETSADDKNPGLRAKVLFLSADIKERNKRWDEAKAAWQSYAEYAQKHADVSFASSATSRIQAIDDMLKQEKAYEAVRQRIAAEKASPPAGTTPPAK